MVTDEVDRLTHELAAGRAHDVREVHNGNNINQKLVLKVWEVRYDTFISPAKRLLLFLFAAIVELAEPFGPVFQMTIRLVRLMVVELPFELLGIPN